MPIDVVCAMSIWWGSGENGALYEPNFVVNTSLASLPPIGISIAIENIPAAWALGTGRWSLYFM